VKLKIATRIFNEEYFIEDFLRYYIELGIEEIHVFDCKSTDKTIQILKRVRNNSTDFKDKIIIAGSNKNFRHTNYLNQTIFCNYILNYAINNFLREKEEIVWMFPDVDEFIRKPDIYELKEYFYNNPSEIFRTVFIEWYLPPNALKLYINPKKILYKITPGKIKGRIMDLWGDPYYKDYIFHLTSQNFDKFRTLKTVSGFHRFISNKQVLIPSNKNFLIVDHLRGVPIDITRQRIEKCLELLSGNEDEWSFRHFSGLKTQINDYENFYREYLKSKDEIYNQMKEISTFNNKTSYFNKVIMQDNVIDLGISKPSMHGC